MAEDNKRTFNAGAFIENELGGTFKGLNEDGTVKVGVYDPEIGDEVERSFNLQKFVQDEFGQNPAEVDFQYNSPETAIEENAVGFGLGTKLAVTKKPEDKLRLLQSEFGEDNVQQASDGFRVKENGVWKQADTSFLSELVADSPIIASGMAGAASGFALGGPFGMILGGGVGAGLAKLAQIEDAENMGIRTEEDGMAALEEAGKEAANAMFWDLMLLGTGKVAKYAFKYGKGLTKRGRDLFRNKDVMAATGEKLVPGTRKADWGTVLRSPEDAQKVKKVMQSVIKHKEKTADGVLSRTVDPATDRIAQHVSRSMKSFKKRAFKEYDDSLSYLDNQGVFSKVKVKAEPLYDSMQASLRELGLVDDAGRFMTKKNAFDQGAIQQVLRGKDRNALGVAYRQLEAASKRQGNLSFAESRRLIQGIDDVLEATGYFNAGEAAISSTARRTLKQIRADLKNTIAKGLDNKFVLDPKGTGKRLKASEIFNTAQARYSNFRNTYDDFAMESAFGGNKTQINSTVQRMIGNKGEALQESFGRMARSVGSDGEKVLRRVEQLQAGKNLSEVYAPATTGLGPTVKQTLFPWTTPRGGVDFAANRAEALAKKSQKLTPETFTKIQATARLGQFVKALAPEDRVMFLNNPELYRPVFESVLGAPFATEQYEQQLLQQGMPQQ